MKCWHPIQGENTDTPSRYMLQRLEISASLMGHLTCMQALSKSLQLPLPSGVFALVRDHLP